MADSVSLFSKGSLIPDILTFETDITERVEAARAEATNMVAEARQKADAKIAEAKRRLPALADKLRSELTSQAEKDTESLVHDQTAGIETLKKAIARNHDDALNAILARVVPDKDAGSRE